MPQVSRNGGCIDSFDSERRGTCMHVGSNINPDADPPWDQSNATYSRDSTQKLARHLHARAHGSQRCCTWQVCAVSGLNLTKCHGWPSRHNLWWQVLSSMCSGKIGNVFAMLSCLRLHSRTSIATISQQLKRCPRSTTVQQHSKLQKVKIQ